MEYPLLTNQRGGKAVSKTRNLCAQIPEELHAKVREEQERLGKTLSEYVGEILEQYFEQQKGGKTMSGNSRTLAFQVSEELFDRLKTYLTANKLTQKGFFVGHIEDVVGEWEASQAALQTEKTMEGEVE